MKIVIVLLPSSIGKYPFGCGHVLHLIPAIIFYFMVYSRIIKNQLKGKICEFMTSENMMTEGSLQLKIKQKSYKKHYPQGSSLVDTTKMNLSGVQSGETDHRSDRSCPR